MQALVRVLVPEQVPVLVQEEYMVLFVLLHLHSTDYQDIPNNNQYRHKHRCRYLRGTNVLSDTHLCEHSR